MHVFQEGASACVCVSKWHVVPVGCLYGVMKGVRENELRDSALAHARARERAREV